MSLPPRPPTPQIYTHRLPSPPPLPQKPSKHLILLHAPFGTAGKPQTALAVSRALGVPYFDGDALHNSAARAAMVGTASGGGTVSGSGGRGAGGGPNEERYQRMWMGKMVRTGLLFPKERRAAGDAWTGFGGASKASSTTTSRRGSASSVSDAESSSGSEWSTRSAAGNSASMTGAGPKSNFTTLSGFTAPQPAPRLMQSEVERARAANPALMVLTHPELEGWHKLAIRRAVGEYGIGVVFVALYAEAEDEDGAVEVEEEDDEEEDDLPILRPLDPRTMMSFGALSLGGMGREREKEEEGWSAEKEVKLRIDVDAGIEEKVAEIVDGVRDLIGTEE